MVGAFVLGAAAGTSAYWNPHIERGHSSGVGASQPVEMRTSAVFLEAAVESFA